MDGGSRQTATSQRGDRLRRRRWRRRRAGAALGAALGLWLLPAAAAAAPQQQGPAAPAPLATGFVFHDRDRDGSRDPEEPGLARVAVSNGREVALTGESGRWILPLLDPDDTTFFVIKPQGWMVPLTEQRVPRFHYSHKPSGSPRLRHAGVPPSGPLPPSIDFPLHPQHEPAELRLVLLGDPQPRDRRELGFLARDVVAELIGLPAAFGVALGDLTFDDLTLFEPLNEVLGQTGFPWFFVLGNHDLNQDAREDRWSDETFERVYGPSYYAFDWGPAHFVVLDDVVWTRGPAGAGYRGGLGQQQLEFLRHDLALVPRERPVVLFMHVPLTEVEDRAALYRLLQARPHVFSVSAHRHYQRHVFIGEEDGWRGTAPHHHLIQATASGDWWQGLPDERGIPHATMRDGAPNGWSLLTLKPDGSYTVDFKPAGRPADWQLAIEAPEVVPRERLGRTAVWVNVFAGSERSRVEMRVGQAAGWKPLERVLRPDPAYERLAERERRLVEPPWIAPSAAVPCHHLWRGYLPADLTPGPHRIEVRTTDLWGRTYTAQRLVRVR